MKQRIMTQAIQTKFLGQTNTRAARIKAWCEAGTLTQEVDYHYRHDERHRIVAMALAAKLDWPGPWYGGSLPNNAGYAFVQPNLEAEQKRAPGHVMLSKDGTVAVFPGPIIDDGR